MANRVWAIATLCTQLTHGFLNLGHPPKRWNSRQGSRIASSNIENEFATRPNIDRAKALFDELDIDADGLVNFPEFCVALSKQALLPQYLNLARSTNTLEQADASEAYTAPLLQDIDLLTTILGDVIKDENAKVYDVSTLLHKQKSKPYKI